MTYPSSHRRIAIVGSGISGLVCAHRLRRQHDVTVFESGERVGGHTNTIRVNTDDESFAIDTGFIVFNETNYPLFSALLDELGVECQPTSMSFSVRCDRSGLEYNGTSIPKLFAQKRNALRPSFLKMLLDIVRFGKEAPRVLEEDDSLSVAAFLKRERYGRGFAKHYLLPLGASLWSCSPATFESFPIRFVVEFLDNHHMLQVANRPTWRVIRGGSFRYVEKLTRDFRDRIRLNCPVRSILRLGDGVRVRFGDGEAENFDEIVLACHADQALELIADPTPTEEELLSSFPYQRNEAVLHTDTSVLPRRRNAWAAWNYHVRVDRVASATLTYDMNILQSIRSKREFLVTLNDDDRIDPERVIRRITYHHPTYDHRRRRAQERHAELVRTNRTSCCGAYWGYGFHEDGVRSAEVVCGAFEGSAPDAKLPV